jgi:hypothetical protein
MILFTSIFVLMISLNITRWVNVSYWGLGGREFLDLNATFDFVSCYQDHGFKIYSIPASDSCGNYVYGVALLILGNFFLVSKWSVTITGYVLLALFSYIIARFVTGMKLRLNVALLLSLSLVVSPPFSLLAQRANIDILILFLLILAIDLKGREKNLFSFFLLALTVLIKFYTLPFLLIVLFQKPYVKFAYWAAGSLITLLTIWNYLLVKELPSQGNYAAFGNKAAFFYLQSAGLLSDQTTKVIGDLIGYLLILIVACFIATGKKAFFPGGTYFAFAREMNLQNAILIVGVSCYVFGMNYDYRLVFLILPLISIRFADSESVNLLKILLMISILFMSYNSSLFIQGIGDVLLGIVISFLFLILSVQLKDVFLAKRQS